MKRWIPLLMVSTGLAGCSRSDSVARVSAPPLPPPPPRQAADQPQTERRAPLSPIVEAARSQIGKTTTYDPAYVGLSYPGGDLPIEKGVCTDVVIRALRGGLSLDLQKLVHEDMTAAFSEYPTIWGLKKPDRNIDHRRVPNLKEYFARHGYSVAVTQNTADFLPGDLVTCTVGRNLAHIMIVSDKKTHDGVPFVIHNIGSGAEEQSCLFDFPLTGHYRITAD